MEKSRRIIPKRGAVALFVVLYVAACNEDQTRPGWEVGAATDSGATAADGTDTERGGFDGGSDANDVDTGRDAGQDAAAPDRASCGEAVEDWPEVSDAYIERSDDTWSRRFPAFRDGCGEYQVLSELDLSASGRHNWTHEMSVAVCNHCSETKSIDFFFAAGGEPRKLKIEWADAVELVGHPWKWPFRISVQSASSNLFLQDCSTARGGGSQPRGLTVERAKIYSNEQVLFEREEPIYWLYDQFDTRPYPTDEHDPKYEAQMNVVPGYWENPVDYTRPLKLSWWFWRMHDVETDYLNDFSGKQFGGGQHFMWSRAVCGWAYYAYGDGEPDLALRKRFFRRYEVGAANFPKPVREYLQDLDKKAPEVE